MQLLQGILVALQPFNLFIAFAGTGIGIIFGALPGLTSTMAVGLLIPVTFGFSPSTGLIFLAGAYCGSMYGGAISAILLNTPGTPASAATAFDGHPMALKGEGGKALAIATIASFVGGIISALCLIFISPELAKVALLFGPAEYFAVAVFGMTIISTLSSRAMLKGCIAGALGLLIGTIGMDPISGYPRFTMGFMEMQEGISIIPALIGLFSASQVMILVEALAPGESLHSMSALKTGKIWISLKELKELFGIMLRGSVIGTTIGIIPAAGGDIAAFLGYNEAARFSKKKDLFGKGNPEGVAGPESANNGVTGGSLIPLLTLGIPGNSVTAIFLGGLLIQGLRPGPSLFTEQAAITYAFFGGMLLANIAVLILGFIGARFFIKILSVPTTLMIPLIFCLCTIGSYSIRNSMFDVALMLVFGVVGYFLKKTGFGTAPVVLGMILGPMAESNCRRILQANQGDLMPMFDKPIVVFLFVLSFLSVVSPFIVQYFENRKKQGSGAGD
ncbi:C4-dicarboxylate ABC transporter permease [Deltaproteobacteria bacterium]|nr:C4-dicarboxylate ABC transporter permease [Deltaproteobacteria bacterium]